MTPSSDKKAWMHYCVTLLGAFGGVKAKALPAAGRGGWYLG
jgi:hypothetical protein